MALRGESQRGHVPLGIDHPLILPRGRELNDLTVPRAGGRQWLRLIQVRGRPGVPVWRGTTPTSSSRRVTIGLVNVDSNTVQHGVEQPMTNAEAQVQTEHKPLMTHPDFVVHEEARLAGQLRSQLDDQYARWFCVRASFTPEQAASCAYLDPARLSPAAHTALRALFGDEEPVASKLLVRRPTP
jgi:hypothetical protein